MPYKDLAERAASKLRWAKTNPEKVKRSQRIHRVKNRDALNESERIRYRNNRDAELERSRRYKLANPEKIRAAATKYCAANKEVAVDRYREWAKANPGKALARCRKRQAAKLNRTPPWASLKEIEKIYQLAARVSKFTGVPMHVDHIIPLQGKNISGLHAENNLQIIPASVNLSKGNRCEL